MKLDLPTLNLPGCDLVIEPVGETLQVFDPIRRRMVALTPEEWVRQHMICYLVKTLAYPAHLLSVEHTLKWQKMVKRCDIVVYVPGLHPAMIVELKAPEVSLSQQTLDQAIRYNQAFRAPYLLLSNGMQHMIIMIRGGEQARVSYLDSIPDWLSLRKAEPGWLR